MRVGGGYDVIEQVGRAQSLSSVAPWPRHFPPSPVSRSVPLQLQTVVVTQTESVVSLTAKDVAYGARPPADRHGSRLICRATAFSCPQRIQSSGIHAPEEPHGGGGGCPSHTAQCV
jgi:hypothetical protein